MKASGFGLLYCAWKRGASSAARSVNSETSGGRRMAVTGVAEEAMVATRARVFQNPIASANESGSDTQITAGTGGANALPSASSVTPRAVAQITVSRVS